jgi:hypothetical protein
MCYFAVVDDKPVVIKEFSDHTAVLFDSIKPLFGLQVNDSRYKRLPFKFTLDYDSRGVKTPTGDILREYRVDTESKPKKGDNKRKLDTKIYRVIKTPVASNKYLVMKRHVNAVSIREKFPEFIRSPDLVRELVKIGRVRTTLFQITDFNTANVVFDSDAKLLFSIDENGMGTCTTKDTDVFRNIRAHVPNLKDIIKSVDEELLAIVDDPDFEAKLSDALDDSITSPSEQEVGRIIALVKGNRSKLQH